MVDVPEIQSRDDFARYLSQIAREVVRSDSERELQPLVESLADWVIASYGGAAESPDWTLLAQIVAAAREGR